MSNDLVIGPLLRYVDETSASIWVEVARPAEVTVTVDRSDTTARTFAVHGHHYALIEIGDLSPGASLPYTVQIDGARVWPPQDAALPPSRIRTMDFRRPLRIAFGSCRVSENHGAHENEQFGVDVLRAQALRMARSSEDTWPDLVLFLGDQVYADETSDEMCTFIASRRSLDAPPGEELRDFQEYAHLYSLVWSDPDNRWLLSTVPSSMIFDDHDIRDDWNTSHTWRQQMAALHWWHNRIVGGLSSYWIYQHLGNLSPEDRGEDEVWQHIKSRQEAGDDSDLGPYFDEFGARSNEHPDSYRWSYGRDLGRTRLVMIDSRASRVLSPKDRWMLDDAEMTWVDDRIRGDLDHLLLGTSLPFLLAPGLHQLETWNEAVSSGAWGRRFASLGERIRQGLDLEHWAAFDQSFRRVAAMVTEVADGGRGSAPANIVFLSGDVHHSYIAEVDRQDGARVMQAVCSPIRNPMPGKARWAARAAAHRSSGRLTRLAVRAAKVPDSPISWSITHGPWFDNCLAMLEIKGRDMRLSWETAVVDDGDAEHPVLQAIHEMQLAG
jgi:phosphodiesterase/alkaline phosphatase D-like protein